MPSVEPAEEMPHSGGASLEHSDRNHGETNGNEEQHHETPDPDRHLIPADRIEHDDSAQIDLPTVREFTQNDNINKFLLNSFLHRMNDTLKEDQLRDTDNSEDALEEQDFES
ncbi:uncharacterized protein LOC126580926 [Anopheles aquasalis]|uniref:Uncharacterized protein n=1 Tax=Anopheles aquasalis TaxID=42839 RepID=T1E8R7_ANOAQ|nr:uncharacterized protein LOC126580926 [Anopheles aquasalis]